MAEKTSKPDEPAKKLIDKNEKTKMKRITNNSKSAIASGSGSLSSENPDTVMSLLQQIHKDQRVYDKKVDGMMDRIKVLETYDYEEHEDYDMNPWSYEDPDCEEGEIENEAPSNKRKLDNNSRFASMSKRSKGQEITGEPLEQCLATNLNDLFRNGMDTMLVYDINNYLLTICYALLHIYKMVPPVI